MSEVKPTRQYKCEVCGKVDKWSDSWRTKTIYHKKWDEILTVCSDECKERCKK